MRKGARRPPSARGRRAGTGRSIPGVTLPAVALLALLAAGGCSDDPVVEHAWTSAAVPFCPETGGNESCADDREGLERPHFDPTGLDIEEVAERGAEALTVATGLTWSAGRAVGDTLFVDLRKATSLPAEGARSALAAYVAEVVVAEGDGAAVLSLGSADGATIWVNGERVATTSALERNLHRHSDVIPVTLRRGPNLVLYKIRHNGVKPMWALYREWRAPDAVDDIVADARAGGALRVLPYHQMLSDTATSVRVEGPSLRLRRGLPEIRLRWETLLGEVLEEVPPSGPWPVRAPLPDDFDGAAMLVARAFDPETGALVSRHRAVVVRMSMLEERARALLAEVADAPGDPVLRARADFARAMFPADGGITVDWLGVDAMVDLYRRLRAPDRFHTFPGRQVWGYRSPSDGSVQPFWAFVPPSVGGSEDAGPYPVVFSVNHAMDPDYWAGRGAVGGFLVGTSSRAAASGTIGVIPHFRGEDRFTEVGREEIPAVVAALDRRLPVDTGRVGLFAWSHHAQSAVLLAAVPEVPLSHLGLVFPGLGRNPRALRPLLRRIAEIRPGLEWLLWSGALDEEVPPSYVSSIAEVVRGEGFATTWINVPYTAHRGGLFIDGETRFYRAVAGDATEGGELP